MRPLGSTGPWAAGAITPRATALLAPNPSWMTLDGTNSWLLAGPGEEDTDGPDPDAPAPEPPAAAAAPAPADAPAEGEGGAS